jgi:type I restriction enzyme M protein
MITEELKSQIDKLWEAFWTSGISNPFTVIEQIKGLDKERADLLKKLKVMLS